MTPIVDALAKLRHIADINVLYDQMGECLNEEDTVLTASHEIVFRRKDAAVWQEAWRSLVARLFDFPPAALLTFDQHGGADLRPFNIKVRFREGCGWDCKLYGSSPWGRLAKGGEVFTATFRRGTDDGQFELHFQAEDGGTNFGSHDRFEVVRG